MDRFRTFLFDTRTLTALGLVTLAACLTVGTVALGLSPGVAVVAFAVVAAVVTAAWVVHRVRARRAARGIEAALDDPGRRVAARDGASDIDVLRERMREAVRTIKTSRLGQATGRAALYELPWYMIIGNPAAGKSSAVVKSGLGFPFADRQGAAVQGIGGTRHCDWFFTSEGILLDTAGRYAVEEEDRSEWLGFLKLLKKQRPKAPINGILIAASLAELPQARPDQAIELAKSLRRRMQELTETLEVFAPVYLVFTKADLMAGFAEFFADCDDAERDRVWGATLPYAPDANADPVAQFDRHFDELADGLKAMSVARLSLHRGKPLAPGVLTFPLEFTAVRPALRAFVATLFEDNPYQFRPVFRGFYFTSALQEGAAPGRAGAQVAERFALDAHADADMTAPALAAAAAGSAGHGFFLKDLFSRVVFADHRLVRQYLPPGRLRARAWTFGAAVVVLALALGGWTWAYLGNRQLVANVRADLDKAVALQRDRVDLASRLEALEVLQDRIEQLDAWRAQRPLVLSLGLYQGDAVDARLREAYFAGVRQVMLEPVARSLETFLAEVNRNAAKLQPMTRAPASAATPLAAAAGASNARPGTPASAMAVAALPAAPSAAQAPTGLFVEASPENVEDAYNALKTYLMLGDAPRREAGHLADQVTRFWRGWLEAHRGTMPREQLIRSAERTLGFALAHLHDAAFPVLAGNVLLVDQTRDSLRRVVRGMPARERVYADVKARAATRFPQMTVARIVGDLDRETIVGSHAISGAFTREAWTGYVEDAFKDAATREMQSADWVLKTAARDDLTLEGSPEQIRKALTDLYKAEYVAEWQRFAQGIAIADFGSFDAAAARMSRLGDPAQSPLGRLMQTVYEQTAWDAGSSTTSPATTAALASAQHGLAGWWRGMLGQAPAPVAVAASAATDGALAARFAADRPTGAVAREFAGVARLVAKRDDGPTPMAGYLEALSKVRTRFHQIKTQGDPGPGARQLMAATLAASGSELADALKHVDEQMLVGMTDAARATLRPLLVRPLMQAFAVLVAPTETELNRVWAAQAVEPFQRTLAAKYPFDAASKVEAGPADIAKVFGPDGAVAKFAGETLAPLVVRRGDTLAARTWAGTGVRLRPEFTVSFAGWVASLEGGAAGAGSAAAGGSAAPAASQTVFQLLPQGTPGVAEYTVEIDGQTLRYRNAAPAWERFTWPNPAGTPGARITAVAHDGRMVELLNEPGRFALTKLLEAAKRKPLGDNLYELSWTRGDASVTVQLRIVSQPGATAPAGGGAAAAATAGTGGLRGAKLPLLMAGADPAPAPVADAALAQAPVQGPAAGARR